MRLSSLLGWVGQLTLARGVSGGGAGPVGFPPEVLVNTDDAEGEDEDEPADGAPLQVGQPGGEAAT